MDEYTIYCTEEHTRKALKLGAPIESVFGKVLPTTANKCNLAVIEDLSYDIPTAEQMVGWLEEQGILIDIHFYCVSWDMGTRTKTGHIISQK